MLAARSPKANAPTRSEAVRLLRGVLNRLGDVMGPNALRSLIRYAAQGEGARLANKRANGDLRRPLEEVAQLLDLELAEFDDGDAQVVVTLTSPDGFQPDDAGLIGLVSGVVEGMLNERRPVRVTLSGEPVVSPGGKLRLEYRT